MTMGFFFFKLWATFSWLFHICKIMSSHLDELISLMDSRAEAEKSGLNNQSQFSAVLRVLWVDPGSHLQEHTPQPHPQALPLLGFLWFTRSLCSWLQVPSSLPSPVPHPCCTHSKACEECMSGRGSGLSSRARALEL
jgi:hypothetical protein